MFLLVYSLLPFVKYYKAPHRYSGKAEIVDLSSDKLFQKGDDGDPDPYYVYRITYQYTVDGVDHRFTVKDKSETENAHRLGQTARVIAYSEDGETYTTVSVGLKSIGVALIGLLCVVVCVWEFISKRKQKRKRDAINRQGGA